MSKENKQKLKEYKKKITMRLKSFNLVFNIFYGFNNVCYDLVIRY